VRPEFLADVAALAEQQRWVTEYQYPDARPLLLARCDLVVYLLLPRWLVMSRVVRRTIRRSLRREVLWNGNREPPLRTFFTDRDHVVRAAWRSHSRRAAPHTSRTSARSDPCSRRRPHLAPRDRPLVAWPVGDRRRQRRQPRVSTLGARSADAGRMLTSCTESILTVRNTCRGPWSRRPRGIRVRALRP
jgi:hypothetical protein